MRLAIVSDIHGNRNAFEAVLRDLRQTSPDLILHGGDLADSGSSPMEIVDQIRDLGWQGVVGNTDEMLFAPESLEEFAKQSPKLQPFFAAIEEMAAATREGLGEARLDWLRSLPRLQILDSIALMHASPLTAWRAPAPEASDAELESIYGPLWQGSVIELQRSSVEPAETGGSLLRGRELRGHPIAVYGHIHRSYIRKMAGMTVINTGSVSLSYDGDRRAAYLLLDGSVPEIRRVEYDVDREIAALRNTGLPHSDWVGRMLSSGLFQMP